MGIFHGLLLEGILFVTSRSLIANPWKNDAILPSFLQNAPFSGEHVNFQGGLKYDLGYASSSQKIKQMG